MNRFLTLTAAILVISCAVAWKVPPLAEATPTGEPFADGAPQAAASVPFAGGEELVYNVSYSAALIPPIGIMRVSIGTLHEVVGGRKQYHIVGRGTTVGGARGLFDIDDTYHSWLDCETLLPSRTASDIREGGYRLSSSCAYDWNAMRAASHVRRIDGGSNVDSSASFPLPELDSGDALTLLYRLRAIGLAELEPGRGGTISLVMAEGTKPVEYRFVGREEVRVKRIGTFRALRFTCTMATSDGSTFQDGMILTAWLSDDALRIPLIVESPVRVGRVRVTLAEGFRTASGRLTSLVE